MSPPNRNDRVPALDLLRFIAAVAVTLYHFVSCYPVGADTAIPAIAGVSAVTRYGYLGVDLFFMISGFVILWSSINRDALGFAIGRFSRLYPAFWASVALTILATHLLSGAAGVTTPRLDLRTIAANATMMPAIFKAPMIEGVYWTLEIEIRFYALIFLMLLVRQMRHVEIALYAWLAVSWLMLLTPMPWIVEYAFLQHYGPFFIGGALFYLGFSRGFNAARVAGLIISAAACTYVSIGQRSQFITADGESAIVVPCLVLLFFGAFAALAILRERLRVPRSAYALGELTYPLYLTHATVGYLVYHILRPKIGVVSAVLVISALAAVLAWLVSVAVDKPARKPVADLLYRGARLFGLARAASSGVPKNILYLIDYWASPGGTERHLAYLLSSLDRTRFNCRVVVFNYQPNALADQARAAGIEILHVPVARYYTPNAIVQGIRLFKLIRAWKIDVVQTFHYKSDVYGALIARLAGVNTIISSKRDAADYKTSFRFLMHKLVRPITRWYIAVSGVVADVIVRKEKVGRERISVIYNGVDLQKYSVPDAAAKAAAKQAIGFAPDDFVVGMSAWFRPEKDHDLLIDACLALAQDAPRLRLALIGGGPRYEHHRQSIAERGLESRIRLVGPVDDVSPYLQALDVACLVPRINEGFSNSLLEKMAMGLPVIATDVGGNREAIAHGTNGYIIAPGDRAQLITLLLGLYRDPTLCARLGAASRARVEQLFSLQEMIRRHETLYTSMTTGVVA